MMSVKTSFHTVKPVKTEERRPLVSNCCIIWATFASAVGETKLALSAMLESGNRAALLGVGEEARRSRRGGRRKARGKSMGAGIKNPSRVRPKEGP